MAGIAFNIRKLLGQQEISSVVAAFVYSGVVSSGPWLFAVFALGVIATFGKSVCPAELVNVFMGIVIYIFAFSTILTYGTQMAITRYLADCLYNQQEKRIPSLLMTTLLLMGGISFIASVPFITLLKLQTIEKLQVLFLMLLVTSMWGAMIFVSTLKAYLQVTIAFVAGFGLAIPASLYMGREFGLSGFLLGLNLGVTVVVFMLSSQVFREFNLKLSFEWELFKAHGKYPVLFLYGMFAGMGIWCDKLLMWFHHQVPVGAGLVSFPLYDGAMFVGYMTALPSLAYFILIAETDLYRIIRQYTYLINNHSSFLSLSKVRDNLISRLKTLFLRIAAYQGVFTCFVLFTAEFWIELMGMSPLQLSMFRIAVLATYFHMGMMLLTIVLTYLNGERQCLTTVLVFFLVNVLGTWLTLEHFWFYGYGYFAAAFIGFFTAFALVAYRLKNLHFYLICSPET